MRIEQFMGHPVLVWEKGDFTDPEAIETIVVSTGGFFAVWLDFKKAKEIHAKDYTAETIATMSTLESGNYINAIASVYDRLSACDKQCILAHEAAHIVHGDTVSDEMKASANAAGVIDNINVEIAADAYAAKLFGAKAVAAALRNVGGAIDSMPFMRKAMDNGFPGLAKLFEGDQVLGTRLAALEA